MLFEALGTDGSRLWLCGLNARDWGLVYGPSRDKNSETV
jgi:hypothetical protein